MNRTVGVTIHNDDDSFSVTSYEVPDDWQPPADWEKSNEIFFPPGVDVQPAAEEWGLMWITEEPDSNVL